VYPRSPHFLQVKGGSFTGDDKDFLKVRLGSNQVIPAFEEALRGMKVGGIRRIIVPEVCRPACHLLQSLTHEPTHYRVTTTCCLTCCRRSGTQRTHLTRWGRSRPTSRWVANDHMPAWLKSCRGQQHTSLASAHAELITLQGRRALDFVLKNQVRQTDVYRNEG
jgi:FKBP-type peptidyl-prolyl cis-trans isomerase